MDHIQALIDKLEAESRLSREEWITLIEGRSPNLAEYLFEKARKWQHRYYGNNVFARGLIEFTNYCKTIVITVGYEGAIRRRSVIG